MTQYEVNSIENKLLVDELWPDFYDDDEEVTEDDFFPDEDDIDEW